MRVTTFCIFVREFSRILADAGRFRGQTPDEMYFGTGDKIPGELETARKVARQERTEANRKRTCIACEPVTVSLN